MIWGVTGHRAVSASTVLLIDAWIAEIGAIANLRATLYHGCCIGTDDIAACTARAHGNIDVVAVVPAATGLISHRALEASHHIIYAPPGRGDTNDYRARNELLVYQLKKQGGTLKGFWNGNTRSGTSMTLNIARRASVTVDIQEIK
jgi:hypothetical protein